MAQVMEESQKSQETGLMTYDEAARFLGVSVARIRQLVSGGKLQKVMVGDHPHLSEEDVRRYAETRRPYRRTAIRRRHRGKGTTVDVIVARIIEDAQNLKTALERYDEDVRTTIAEQIRKAK